jgi:hypothetical protein
MRQRAAVFGRERPGEFLSAGRNMGIGSKKNQFM